MTVLRLLSAALLTSASLAADAPCLVRVHLSDELGNAVSKADVRILGPGTVLEVNPDQPFRVNGGTYTVNVGAPGFRNLSIPVVVDQLEQVVPVTLQMGEIGGPDASCAIYGHVAGGTVISHLRLTQMFGSRLIDVPLDSARSFAFRSIACAPYLLVIVGPHACLGTMAVTATNTMAPL